MVLANGKQKWISDIIGESYKKWKNEFVILDCGTGSGKSYFCIRVLGSYAQEAGKKILYLCNRSKLREQIKRNVFELGLVETIHTMTYQTLQQNIQDNKAMDLYDYVIADECHYFTTDAMFNDYTDIAYKYVMKQKNAVVLLVSATAKAYFGWLIAKKKVKKRNIFTMNKDYSYVDKVYIYQKDELATIINGIIETEPDSKIIVFCNSAKRMLEMYEQYSGKADYFCSNSSENVKLKKICGWNKETNEVYDCIKRFADGRITFEKRILFTTTVLDNGVDLKDKRIKHVFTEVFDPDGLIQSLGRKRKLGQEDNCTFYIREYPIRDIYGFENLINKELEPVELYRNDYGEFYSKYGQDRKKIKSNKIFYSSFKKNKVSGEIRVNECRYRKYKQDATIIEEMKQKGYVPVLLTFLGEELISKTERIDVSVEKIDSFKRYLQSIEGKRLFAEDRNAVKDKFESIGVVLRYTGINTFNGALEDYYEESYPCRFYNKSPAGKSYIDGRRKLEDGSKNPNNNKRYWILEAR